MDMTVSTQTTFGSIIRAELDQKLPATSGFLGLPMPVVLLKNDH
jgi:hypothetical protein